MVSAAGLDVVIFGATGYTGRLVAEHFMRHYGRDSGIRWGIAGHSVDRLTAVRDEIGAPEDLAILVADAFDAKSLTDMASRTKAVISTVGPYGIYGAELVAACVDTGTDYLDLCGEPAFMRSMIDRHGDRARQTGARILFSCGFDSIPFELGVWFLQNEALKRFGTPFTNVTGRVRRFDGGFSGGTLATIRLNMEGGGDPGTAEILDDPYGLTPGFRGVPQPDQNQVEYDEGCQSWVAPFMMAMINVKNIHRANALMDHLYGRDFSYDERILTGDGDAGEQAARAIALSLQELPDTTAIPLGSGPTREEREAGGYEILFSGQHADGGQLRISVTGDQDPGYGSTSKIISETSLCLIQQRSGLPGGVWTPGAALGAKLVDQLSDKAGLTFRVEAP